MARGAFLVSGWEVLDGGHRPRAVILSAELGGHVLEVLGLAEGDGRAAVRDVERADPRWLGGSNPHRPVGDVGLVGVVGSFDGGPVGEGRGERGVAVHAHEFPQVDGGGGAATEHGLAAVAGLGAVQVEAEGCQAPPIGGQLHPMLPLAEGKEENEGRRVPHRGEHSKGVRHHQRLMGGAHYARVAHGETRNVGSVAGGEPYLEACHGMEDGIERV